jgi:hypothetical protein
MGLSNAKAMHSIYSWGRHRAAEQRNEIAPS